MPSVALQGLLGDATARVLYPNPSGDWIEADGEAVDVDNPARMVTKVFGPTAAWWLPSTRHVNEASTPVW